MYILKDDIYLTLNTPDKKCELNDHDIFIKKIDGKGELLVATNRIENSNNYSIGDSGWIE